MANKLFLVSTTLAFFFLLTNASIYRTVVEFEEDTNPIGPFRPQQKCRKEPQQLVACQEWIQRQTMQPSLDDFEENWQGGGSQQMPPQLRQCCNELQREDTACVCPALKQAAEAVRVQGQHGPFTASHIYWTAKNLPNVCNLPRVDVCPFTTIPFFPPY